VVRTRAVQLMRERGGVHGDHFLSVLAAAGLDSPRQHDSTVQFSSVKRGRGPPRPGRRRARLQRREMLHHLSISAENPENVAQVLAEIMGGIVVPFRPNPGSFMAFALDEYGTELEIRT